MPLLRLRVHVSLEFDGASSRARADHGTAQLSWDQTLGVTDSTSLRATEPSGGQSSMGSPCVPLTSGGLWTGAAEERPTAAAVCLAFPVFYEGPGCTGDFTIIGTG